MILRFLDTPLMMLVLIIVLLNECLYRQLTRFNFNDNDVIFVGGNMTTVSKAFVKTVALTSAEVKCLCKLKMSKNAVQFSVGKLIGIVLFQCHAYHYAFLLMGFSTNLGQKLIPPVYKSVHENPHFNYHITFE